MTRHALLLAAVAGALSACGGGDPQTQPKAKSISVQNPFHDQLNALTPPMRMLGLMRALRDTGHRCRRVENGRFQQDHRGMKMWTARCDDDRQWAIFIAPNADLQVRPCAQAQQLGLPACGPLPADVVPLPV